MPRAAVPAQANGELSRAALLEQLDGLLALPLQVLDEDLEVFITVQHVQLVLQHE